MSALLLLAVLVAPAPAATSVAAEARALRWAVVEWRDAWERRDVDAFVECFSPSYATPQGLDRDRMASQKREVFSRTNRIEVTLSDISIEVHGESGTVRFQQTYVSDHHRDRGRKTLLFSKENGKWLITGESFEPER